MNFFNKSHTKILRLFLNVYYLYKIFFYLKTYTRCPKMSKIRFMFLPVRNKQAK